MTTPGNFFLIELLGPEMLIRACVHIVQSLMESLRGYMGGIIDFYNWNSLLLRGSKKNAALLPAASYSWEEG